MINKKQFLNTTILYGFGFLSIRFVSFLLLPLHTNLLSPEVVGFVFLLMVLLAFMNTIYNHGMDASMLRCFYEDGYKSVVSTSILYSIVCCFCFSGIFIFFNQTIYSVFISDVGSFCFSLCLCLILSCDVLSVRLLNVLRMLEKPYYYLCVCLMNVFVSVFLNVLFIKNLMLGFDGVLFALLGTSLVQLLFLSPVLLTNVRFSLFNKKLLNKMFLFGLPILPAAIFLVAVELADRWMLKWFENAVSVGLYGAGYKLGSLILIVVKSFNLNWQPHYLKYKNNYKNGGFEFIGTVFLLFLIFLCTVLSLAYPYVVQINLNSFYLIGKSFWEGVRVVPIIAFSYLFYGLFILQMPAIYIKNKQKWLPVFWGCGFLVNVVGNIILIPLFSYMGAAISTFICYAFMSFFLVFKNRRWMPVAYNIKKIIILAMFSLLVLCLQSFFDGLFFMLIIYSLGGGLFIKKSFVYSK